MPHTPVNLSRYRKAKLRADRKRQADANAVRFGRSKSEKTRDRAQVQNVTRLLDHHKREDRDSDEAP